MRFSVLVMCAASVVLLSSVQAASEGGSQDVGQGDVNQGATESEDLLEDLDPEMSIRVDKSQ